MMRALDSRRATGHDSRVAVKQRPGTRKPEGKRPEAAMQNAGGFFHGLVRPCYGRPGGRSLAARRCFPGLPTPVRSPARLGSGSAVQKPQLEPRQMNAITQGASAPAVESLIVEGLITVKIGPRGGSSLFLAGFE